MNKDFKLDKKNIQDIVDLTSLQEGILFHYLKNVSKNLYFVQLSLEIQGAVSFDIFEKAWNKVFANNEMLRTLYRWEKLNKPIQLILKEKCVDIRYYDLSKEENTIESEYQKIKLKDFEESFDLKEVPFRLTLCKINTDQYRLLISNHHIIYDGWSNGIILKEFLNYYNNSVNGSSLKVDKKAQFKNYLKLNRELSIEDETFWKDYLKGIEPKNVFSFKNSGSSSENFKNESHRFSISEDKFSKLKQVCKSQKITIADILYGAWGVLLSKYSGESDMLFGTTISGRNIKFEGIEQMVGLFINTIPIRLRITPDKSLISILKENAKQTLERGRFENVPLRNILDYSGYTENELLESIFVVENYPLDKENLQKQDELAFKSFSIQETTNYKLTVSALISNEIEISFNYISAYFEKELIENLEKHYVRIIDTIIDDNKLAIQALDILSEEEKHQLLYEFNNTETKYPKNKTIHKLFEEQVLKNPHRISVSSGDVCISYNELNNRSNQLAWYLKESGVNIGDVVGLNTERTEDLITGILGILKCGAAYLPLNSSWPKERINFMLSDSGCKTIIHGGTGLESNDINCNLIDIRNQDIYKGLKANLELAIKSSNTVYIIYTSGTTGNPKGVLTTHANVSRVVSDTEYISINSRDNILQLSSYTFDGSVFDIYGALLNGSGLVMINNDDLLDIGLLVDIILKKQISIFFLTTALFNTIVDYGMSKLNAVRKILFGGERISVQHTQKALEALGEEKLIHVYGPTETTVFASYHNINSIDEERETIPIGTPISNTSIYLFDSREKLVPKGVPGEIYIGGYGNATGYLNNPELTNNKFVTNPYNAGDVLYRTGDLARFLTNGSIEFLGRIDDQVKIRGFRIELGEIESTLLKHENIKESVVLAIENDYEKYLCAYIVSKKEFSHEELRAYMSEQLPDYMLPTYIVELESFPLTTNGKVNRKALPSPEIKAGDDYVAPSNEIEEKLVAIWSEVLNINKEDISVNSNFFSIGGHSLKATVLTSKIHKEIGVEFPLREVFVHPTVKSQASQITISTKKDFVSIPKAKEQTNYVLSSAQKRLYLLQQFDLTSTAYNMPGTISLGKDADKSKIENVFKQLINRHESFRTSITVVDSEPVQLISNDVKFELEELSIEKPELENTRNKFIKPFDLSKAPFLRVSMVDIKGEDSLLMIDMHHIISDGASHAILEKEFQALLSGEELPALSLQYKDYSQWQNSKEQQEIIKDQEQYWLNEFEGEIPVLNLPTDNVRPVLQSHEGATVNFVLSKEETEGIKSFTKENDLTLYMTLLSIFNILLSKLSGQDDIVVGTPIAGRNHADLENIVGMFLNTLSIRNEVKGEDTIQDFVSNLKQTVLGAYENQNYQFEDLVDKLSIERDASRNPIFDVMFNLLNQAEYSEDMSGFNTQEQAHKTGMSKFDLTLTGVDYGEQLMFSFTYCRKLFKAETIDRFINYFKKIITDLGKSGNNLRIKEIEIIPEKIKQKKLTYFNDNLKCKLKHTSIQSKLEESYSQYIDKVAIETGAEHITYSVLNNRKQFISNWIVDKNIEKESLVGIFINDKTKVIISILGILDSSCVFVPIDTNLPVNKIKAMIDKIGLKYFVTGKEEESKLNQIIPSLKKDNILNPDDLIHNENTLKIDDKRKSLSSDKIYIYFTSGSSGTPKPIIGKNESLLQFIEWEIEKIKVDKSFRVSQLASVGFDAFLKDIFVPLLSGGTVCIPNDNKTIMDEQGLITWINRRMLTLVHCVPSVFKLFSNENVLKSYYRSLKYVLLAGEQISLPDLVNWYSIFGNKIQLVNLYGATETTLLRTFFFIKPEDVERSRLPIGQTIPGSRMLILDKNKNVCDTGISGELYLRTAYSTFGYYNDNQLTKEKFVENPFAGDNIPLYRTGDLAVENTSGEIEIIGRIDHQVKIRGIRIELGEIENVLLKHENIKESVVLAREENEDKYLCAYLVTEEDLNQEEIRTFLSVSLPDYMIPSYFVELESLPLNTNGKVNRKALPSPEIKAGNDYVVPSTEIEEKLVEIWSKVLNINGEDISVNANFFSIGGHSLKATVLTSNIHKEIGVEFPLREVFLHQTIKSQANRIENSTKKDFASIPKAKEQSNYPLSSAQKRLYLLQQFDLKSIAYNMPYVIPLGKGVDKSKIEEVFKQLINRHESFRTSIIVAEQEPVQIISKNVTFEVEELSIENTELENTRNKFIKPFDLSQAPFLRAAIVDVKGEDSLLMIDMHHIISDGTSHTILEKEFQSLLSGEELASLPLQYKDYSQWQNSKNQQELIKDQEQYWLNKFEGEIPVLNLPIDYVRPLMQSNEGATVSFILSKEETKGLRFFTKENDLTLYMSLLSVFSILLSELSGQDDIIVGTPIAGRNHFDLENIVGMFVNTLAIRNEVKRDETIQEFVSNLKQTVLGAYENQNYQFEDLVDKVSLERDTSRNPIFDVVINLLNQAEQRADIFGFKNTEWVHEIGISKFDLTLTAVDYGDQLMLSFEYCTQLFKAETINRFIVYFKQIVSQIAQNKEGKLSELEIISTEEKQQILYTFNDTQVPYPSQKSIAQVFNEQVKEFTGKIALEDKDKSYTYQDLDEESNKIANYLIERGVGEEQLVGLMAGRTSEMIIGILGILKTGGAYVPINPAYPKERVNQLIEDSGINILLSTEPIDFECNLSVGIINISNTEIKESSTHLSLPSISSSNIAYVMYTSGSTGTPKGVVIEQKSVLRLVQNNQFFPFHSEQKILLTGAPVFDATTFEIWGALLNGGSLYIASNEVIINSELLSECIRENSITSLWLTSSLFNQLVDHNESIFDTLKFLLVGGDVLSVKHINKIRTRNSELVIINGYGPTENTTFSTTLNIEKQYESNIPIGKPISNSTAYIFDKSNKLQAVGVPGELLVGGDGLAREYLNNQELTLEKFIENPYKEGERLYKTGDLARWLPDGNIEFLGRIDQQVKIRGFRIELGEIESNLLKHKNIKESIVLAIEENNDTYLCAYVVFKEWFSDEELRAYMLKQLPEYMVPSYFVELESLPLNANGKVNRKALPSPQIIAGDDYMAPSTEIEEKLLEIWSEVLNIEEEVISTTANFFAVGGHSLKATILTGKIYKEIEVEFPLREVFAHPTIKFQASQIAKRTKKDFVSIPKATEQSNYQLSSAQKRLYLLQQFDLTSTAYNMPGIISLGKEVDKSRIKEVFKQIINRHESFRTSIIVVNEEPVQVISKDVEFEIEELSIENKELENTRNKFIKPFDLSKAPFLRAAIVDIKGEDSLLMLDMHHIISDGSSHTILEKEFQALLSGEELAPLPLQYKDYSQWQNSKEQQELIKNQEQYWLTKFEGEIPVLNLPSDFVRPIMQSHEGAKVSFVLSKEETEGIKSFTKENDLTLYMTVLSVFSILLSKLSGQDDIVVGTPIAGRNHADLENIVGMFVNTLSIRNEVRGEKTIQEFVSSLKQTVLGAYENQNYQFEDLVDKVSVERDTSRNPIFDVMFNLLNQAEQSGDISEMEILIHTKGISKFDLTLGAVDYGDQLMLSFEYCTQLFKAETIDRFIVYFKQIVNQLAEKSEIKISAIDILTEEEKHQLLYEFNNTTADYPKDKTIYQLFDEQVARTPDNIAVSTKDKSVNYKELHLMAEKLAKVLWSNGVSQGSVVSLMLDRSIEMIIGLMGILRAGCCYLPIIPSMPKSRLDYVLKDSESPLILTQTKYEDNLTGVRSINLEEIESLSYSPENLPEQNNPNNLAYIIYTSGTTGNPKGVMIENHSVLNRIKWMQKNYPITTGDVILQKTPYTFDVSVWELFWWSCEGASVYMLEPEGEKDPQLISKTIEEKKISVMHFVPSMLEAYLKVMEPDSQNINLGSMKYVFSSGEALKPNQVNSFYQLFADKVNTKLVNLYGPTEATVDVSYFDCLRNVDYKSIPIGKPIDNTELYILDKNSLQLQAVGIIGELMISGVGLSRGYLKKDDLTKEKFIDHPYKEGEKLYRTGDLARWLPDGNIEFLGRLDHQVKIRGYRIELGEIENTLQKHERINECLVLAREENGDKYLCAYLVSKEELNHEELRTFMSAQLPDYMIPSYFVQIDELQLTSNGKVNRKALPSPKIIAGDDYIAPSTEIEKSLVEIWSEVLNIDKEDISLNANFFSIGGHSLKATILTGKIYKELGVEFLLREVFLHSTIKSQASQIETRTKKEFVSIPKAKEQSNYPVSPAQKRIYLLQQFDLTSTAYNMPYAIPLEMEYDQSKIKEVFREMILRHDSFRTSFELVRENPVQIINKEVEFKLEKYSIDKSEKDKLRNKFIKSFDLSKAPLLRAAIVDIIGEESLLIIDVHHIISDGVSQTIFEKEFKALYLGEVLPPLSVQFKDYAVWQDQLLKNTEYNKKVRNFWKENIGGGFPEIKLPYDFNIKTEDKYSSEYQFYINDSTLLPLRNLANKQSTSLFTVVYSVFNILLSYLTGEEDVFCSVINSGRTINQVQELVGCFANSVLIKNNLNSKKNVLELIANNHNGFMDVHGFQDFYYEEILEEKGIKYPEVPVAFNMLNFKENIGSFSGNDSHNHRANVGRAKFDIELYVNEYETGLNINWIYNNSLFKPETIEYIASRYNGLLGAIVKEADNLLNLKIHDVKVEIPQQKIERVYPSNSYLEFEKDIETNIITRFKSQVAKYGEKTAIEYYDESYSYVDLDQESNQIANTILSGKTINNEGVALLFEHGNDMINAMIGVLKSGNYYIPLDAGYPVNRLSYIIKDSGTKILITNKKNEQKANELKKEIGKEIRIINLSFDIKNISTVCPNVKITPDSLAFISYTSGSTGVPKGIIQNHRNVLHYIRSYTNNIHLSSDDKLTLFSSYAFAASVQDIFGAILNGASLHIYNIKQEGEKSRLQDWIVRKGITIYHSIPTIFRYLVSNLKSIHSLERVRLVVLGGETVYKKDFYEYKNFFNEKCIFINCYGSTESPLIAENILDKSSEVRRELVPVGFGLANTEVYLEKPDGSLALPYEEGEIIIKSKHLTLGYLNDPEKTMQSFTKDEGGKVVFKTGDIGKNLADYNIENIGRKDYQVKIRGYRVELGEVEGLLDRYNGVSKSVVHYFIQKEQEGFLTAYYILDKGISIEKEELKKYIELQVPSYMVPMFFIQLDEFPYTLTGKIDRKALPSPEAKVVDDFVAPSTELEENLLDIWSEVLNIDKEEISVNANFLDIGGNSFRALVLMSKIHKATNVEFPLKDIFVHTSIKAQANQIKISTKKEFVAVPKAKEQPNYPLSSAQKRLYLLQQFDLTSTAYNMPKLISLGKEADKSKIEEVFKQLINRHENFRTSFIVADGEPVQIISEDVDFEVEELSIEKPEIENTRNKFIKPFDLSKAPLLRAAIVHIKGEGSLLMIDLHHIISDGTSHIILEKEFQILLSGEELAPLPLQYKDYSQWQNSKEQQERVKNQEQYWLNKFEGEIPVLNLPSDYVRPIMQSHEGATVNFVLSKKETEGLKTFTKENDLTLYMSLLSVFNILLSKLSGQNDIVVGTPIAGRNHADLENIVGMFVNTLSIRNKVEGEDTIQEFVSNLKQTVLGAYENQNYQFEDLVDKVSVERDTSRNPIFDVMFNLLNQAEYSKDISGFNNQEQEHKIGISKLDLALLAVDYGEQLMLSFEYCTQLFKAETIDRFIEYFKQIVGQLEINFEIKISEIDILTEEEKHQLLYEFNNTKVDYPKDKTIHQLFEEQVVKTPNNLALIFENKQLTYKELNKRANQLGHYLNVKGVKPESLVAISVDRSFDMIIGILGILKAGGAYIPIDPAYPDNRKANMLQDSECNIFLTQEHLKFPQSNTVAVYIDNDWDKINEESCENLNSEVQSNNLAYVIYTSGSTGTPKGVLVEHKSVVNYIHWSITTYQFNKNDTVGKYINIAFDASVEELYPTLLSGATLNIIPEEYLADIKKMKYYLEKNNISIMVLPATITDQVLKEEIRSLRILISGGDKLQAIPKTNFDVFNHYGPTEATVTCLNHKVTHTRKNIPLGRPLANVTVFIIDENSKLVPIGVPGELCISGAGLARGYLKRPDLTAQKFIKNPFSKDPNSRLYKTGDLARCLPNGNIEFLGRIDQQVKIRGFRIELGEIESTLLKHENIKESIVLAIEENNDKYLCAYVVCKEEFSDEDLRAYMSEQLPDYMLPSYFVELESLPLTSNGKVNRKVLPLPHIKTGDDYVAPSNKIEENLLEIWSEVLNIDKENISVNANFFSIGGHSLKATVLTSNIHKKIGVEFPLREVFLHSTIKSQASQIEKSTKKEFVSISKAKEQSNYPVSPAQKRLYLLQQFDLNSTAYNMPRIIPLGKEVDKSKIEEVFKQLIKRHESFRTSFIVADGEPVQIISKNVEFELEKLSIENTEIENIRNKFIKPFDLSQAPLLRVAIVDIKGEDSLLIDMHHIISDGTSHTILEKEFQALFSGEKLAPLPLQYKDYSQWQNSKEQQEAIKNQEQYWLNKFEGEIPVLNLPSDYVRPLMQSHEGATVNFVLSKEETEEIKIFTKENDLTLYMSLLSVFSILLSKLSGQDDIVVGTPIVGRNHADLENILGMFVNTLSIRNEVKGEETIRDFVSNVKQTVLGAYENQNYQFEDLVDKVSAERDTSRNPIFDVMINLLNQADYSGDISGVDYENRIHTKGISKFDLTFTAVDYGEQLMLSFEYCTQLFKAETINRFIVYFKQIVDKLAGKSETKISAIDILTEKEKHQLLYEFNNTETEYPKDKTIYQLFEEQVERTPENVAVCCEGKALTYSELNKKANIAAHHIREIGIDRDDIISIFLDRSIENVFTMLGVLKSGGAYLPLDPDYPDERIDFILNDSRSKIVISTKDLSERIQFEGSIICVEDLSVLEDNISNIETINKPSDLCYIIYTSGTTGMPKGVMVEHKNLVRLFFNEKFQFDFNEKDIWTMFHSHCFDFSVWEMYGALLYGGKLIVIPKIVARDVVEYHKLLKEEKVTVLNQTPSAFYNLSEIALQEPGKSLESLRYVIFGGEALKPNRLAEWFNIYPDVKLINMYGITETTVHVTYKEIGKNEIENNEIENNISNIGTSIPTLTTYIVDENLKLVPKGVAGELLIGGAGLSRGYLGREDLTREKFIQNPYKPEERLYRSGDLVKMLSNGEMEYLGRIDHQVQLRGFRIELGEIENTLLKHENIKESVVLAIEENNDKYLCAYIVSKEEVNHKELRTYVSSQLPDYMAPSYFVELDSLPLNANGKVNRKALPSPEIEAGDDYVAPSNETEEKLAEIWSEVLNIEKEEISTKANFFSIGGHSLNVLNVVSAIKEKFGINLPLMHIYSASNIKTLAKDILSKEYVSNDFEVYNNENNNKVFCFPPMVGYGSCFAEVARLIPEFCFYSFNYINTEDLVKFYADKIIEVDNQGSYKLLGYSAGCSLISLVAKELEKRGMIVSDVILIDGYWDEKDLNQLIEVKEDEIDSELEMFLFNIKESLKKMNMNFLINETREKIIDYSRFLSNINGFEIINAKVHFIQSQLKDEVKEEKLEIVHQMQQYTNDKLFIYSGNGEHRNMLAPEFLEENVKIIRKCLSLVNW